MKHTETDANGFPAAEEPEEVAGIDLFADADLTEERPRGRRPALWLFLIAAVVVLVLLIVGITTLTHRGSATQQASSTVASKVRDAADKKTITQDAKVGEITVVYSTKVDAFAVKLEDAPKPQSGQEYQVSVTNDDANQSFDSRGLIGRSPSGTWHGFRGVDGVMTVHVTPVAKGGESAPESDDLAEVRLRK